MLLNGVDLPDDRTRHVVAELLNSIFDIDKMLYFVAPEWWRPRLHRSRQQLQETPSAPLLDAASPSNGTSTTARAARRACSTAHRSGDCNWPPAS